MVMLMLVNNIFMFPQSGKQKVYTIGARGGKFCPRIKKMTNMFEYIWAGIIYGHAGDGVARIHLQQTPAEQMAEDFFEWIKKEKSAKGFSLNSDRAMKYNVWCNQEGFIFTNEKYEPHEFDDLVVITY